MPERTIKKRNSQLMLAIASGLKEQLPHLFAVLDNEQDFIELRVKARDDGSTLAILKRYDAEGGPVVCFGNGYGCVGALMAIDATIQGGSWRVDKPWDPGGSK